ncbi:ammonium transporter [Mongoliimonas terrestris]|uniref:ammonium transporter n=1 Tax=Mongoliimonas terrestris TaxID=1709001 RepID=UPI0009499EEA
MKNLKTLLAAAPMVVLAATAVFAQDAAAPAADAAAAAAPAAPVPDKGDTTWMLLSTILVILMTLPGLALFYGGLVRAKNILSILMQVFIGFSLISILWVVYGYSIAFTGPGTAEEVTALSPFFGGLSKAFLSGVKLDSLAETFTQGVFIPELTFVIFQLTFAGITPALIIGATAERMKFSAVLFFLVLWFTFSYLPMAHMVWWWGGPSAPDAPTGYLFAAGAYDFAGGTVVHINAGIAALVAAIMVGPRVGYGKENMAPHNLVWTVIGASLLWVGWFGFNAGSNLEANGLTAQAMLNTIVATAAAALAWTFVEWLTRGHPSALGAASGAVAGLVAVTPAAGFAGAGGAIFIGVVSGVVCLWAVVWLKAKLKYDDSLDVFGVHGVGGIVGAILTGVVASESLGGFPLAGYEMGTQVWNQIHAVLVCVIWSTVVSVVSLLIVKSVIGLRVPEAAEREGLDVTTHGERAYN